MSTTLAFLGDFGDAIEYIFSSRETREGTTVGGSQFLELTWEHLKLTFAAMASPAPPRSRSASGSGTSAGAGSSRSASRTSAARCRASR